MYTFHPSIEHDTTAKLAFETRELSSVIVVTGLVVLATLIASRVISRDNGIPGVPRFYGGPMLGVVPMYLQHGMPELLGQLIATGKDGIAYANVMGNSLVSIHDPAMTKEVLSYPEEVASREGNPSSMQWSPFSTLRRLIGDNLFSYTGPETSHRRNLFIREFNNTNINAEKFDTVARIAARHADILARDCLTADISDVGHIANNFAVSMWGETLYGHPDYYLDDEVLSLAEEIIGLAGSPWSSIWYTIQLFLGLVASGASTRAERIIKEGVDRVVMRSIEKLEECEETEPDAALKTMRSLSIKSGGGRMGSLSNFAAEFANLNLFGGHHSVGSIVTWTMVELDKHPECLVKLMSEIDSVDTMTFAKVNSEMPYLDAVVMEINRLYPVVHATLRIMHREMTLVSGKKPVVLKPDMLVYLSFLHLQTSKQYWGPDAEVFVPERLLGGHSKEHPLLAFGYGPRNCVGYKFALLATKVYLVTLLKKYTFALKEHDHAMKIGTLIETTKPVAMRVTRR